jgi:hypothetical protein
VGDDCKGTCARLRAERDQLLQELKVANDLIAWYSARLRQALAGRPTGAAAVPDCVIWWRGKGGDDGR